MQPQYRLWIVPSVFCVVAQLMAAGGEPARVQIARNDTARRVDVTIDGRPFTSYIYPASLKKPVLFPIRSAAGVLVTRGFPLDPRPRERVDHPHHVGLWFNHGDVNGLDFWNNSGAITAERATKMGAITHRTIVNTQDGADRGELVVESDWTQPDGAVLLVERTAFVFRGAGNLRSIDRITTLTARHEPVVFRDSKEGTLGLRVARELEQPAEKPEVYTDAAGRPSAVPLLDNSGVTGLYESSDGKKGDAVWGTRGPWMLLGATVNGQRLTVAMLDHPTNTGYPGYWHARGYGLFALNPLGRKSYDEKKKELIVRLEPGQSVTFRHRVLIADGELTKAAMEAESMSFAGTR